jgi:uncharacterized protein (DUF1330 family)
MSKGLLAMTKQTTTSRRFSTLSTVAIGALAFVAGFGVAGGTLAQEGTPAGYIVVSASATPTDPEAMAVYRAAAGPLAVAAGLEIVARSPKVTVLEGEWPYEEGITIERFTSIAAVIDFWYSDAYQEAKKLREGASKINFIVALEGAPVTQ